MNYLWGFMIVIGIIYAAFNGTLPEVTEAAVSSAKEAVTLCITMMGVMSFWVGMMRIAENAGIIEGATKKLMPVLRFLFPEIPVKHPANKHIATNMIANMFGLGWAATPAGLKAMEELANLEEERTGRKNTGIATKEMCIFLIINISSLQLIPVNVIAYRSQYGSVDAASVIGPGLIATTISTLGAIVFCKLINKKSV
ncbi:MAG: nucleoside recognition protein [Lachnospiraceae bacterium]|nr:nucleoside recognition protein [Lachnospiraceae bacterium]